MKRVVTYDVRQGNNYTRFYDFVKETAAMKITESSYLFNTELTQSDFEKKLREVFNAGDNVAYISENDRVGLFYIKIKI